MNVKLLFHYISYLQYPLMAIALYFAIKPYLNGININEEQINSIFKNLNNVLIFMGLAISFSTLQDTTKTQNKMSKDVWEDPKKGKIFILLISFLTLFLIIIGLTGLFSSSDNKLKDLSIGVIVLGIGLIGLLRTSIEMFENHRKDKNTQVDNLQTHS